MLLQVFSGWFFSISFFMLDSVMLIGGFSFLFLLFTCLLVSSLCTTWFMVIAFIVHVGGLLTFLAVLPNPIISQRNDNFTGRLASSAMTVLKGLSGFFWSVLFLTIKLVVLVSITLFSLFLLLFLSVIRSKVSVAKTICFASVCVGSLL